VEACSTLKQATPSKSPTTSFDHKFQAHTPKLGGVIEGASDMESNNTLRNQPSSRKATKELHHK
jgi:hypothetical protein